MVQKRSPRLQPSRPSYWKWVSILVATLVLLDIASSIWAEGLWFQELAQLQVFWRRLNTQVLLSLLAFSVSLAFLLGNLALARSWYQRTPFLEDPKFPYQGLRLRSLLVLTLGLGVMLGILVLYHGQVALSYWGTPLSLYNPSPPLPLWAKPETIGAVGTQLVQYPWLVLVLLGGAIALLFYPFAILTGAAVLISLSFAQALSAQWVKVLPALYPTAFNQVDPLFQKDISFYVFALPVWELLEFWLTGLFFFIVLAVTLIYLLSGSSLSQGRFPGFSPRQQRHLYGLGGGLLLSTALLHWLARYEVLFSTQGVTYGASFTNVQVDLPVNTGLSLFALILGLGLIWRTFFWSISLLSIWEWLVAVMQGKNAYLPPFQPHPLRFRVLLGAFSLYLTTVAIGGWLLPLVVQRVVVQPNELQREIPFIQRTIRLTRAAFALDDIEVEEFNPQGNLTLADLQANDLTVSNIRLWDPRPLLESNRQLQQIRLYYEFYDADMDRYTLQAEAGDLERRQVLISARELNYEQVPEEAKTWVNEHLIYTHGYGFTMSPVNTAGPGGLPYYFIRDIGHVASSEAVERSIPIGKPRIYYGELTNTYVMAPTQVPELDYPSGSENVYTQYAGTGGVGLGNIWQRLLFAKHLRDWRMLLSRDFNSDTRLLFRRNIRERVNTLAPFLRFDNDPYLVVADVTGSDGFSPPAGVEPNYLYWMIDAYTTSDRYPYSDPGQNDFNYIRNSVKIVVDAFNGAVHFYVANGQDPIIQTWGKVFPGLLQPMAEMPEGLRSHIRYPQDFYQVQSDQLMVYHMTDPQVFYNREDQWRAPNEIYANESQEVAPYYLIMKLPDGETEEFILLRPFTPAQRNNMIAWLAARSDGDLYGSKLLYRFPKQELVFGPEQIEARINQTPEISERISLWNRQGSRAQQGNLLVIPIEQSLLYVEPLYLVAEQNQLPTLVRVIMVHANRIAMANNLENVIDAIFGNSVGDNTTILEDLEDEELLNDLILPESSSPATNEAVPSTP